MPIVKDSKENFKKCSCFICPSYNECMKKSKKKLYCATGKTSCKLSENGCFCGSCPVHSENKLEGYYYCLSGKA